MKPMNSYALKLLRLGQLMRLNYRQAGLVLPHKIYYLWDLAKPESKRSFEWYAIPYDVMKSPNATQSMIYEAMYIKDRHPLPPERAAKGKKPRKIIPGIVEPYPAPLPAKVEQAKPVKPATQEKDWI